MKRFKNLFFAVTMLFPFSIFAQNTIQFTRPSDQRGLHVFETSKLDTVEYKGFNVKIGGDFTQQFQAIEHSNTASPDLVTVGGVTRNLNLLFPVSTGFNLALANLRLDVQLADGIKVTLENYMTSRHHNLYFMVKGGYIQFDKLPFLGNPAWFADHVTVKIGHFGLNYGDQQFRRSDNANTVHNPFIENLIMDAFTTEIGGEVYVYPVDNFFVMAGMTNGLLNTDLRDQAVDKNPSFLGKIGYDNQITDDLRLRLSTSFYHNNGTIASTLYAGDRAGSHYYFVMEPEFFRGAGGVVTASTAANRFTSGRINPGFRNNVTAFVVNPFVKFRGLEFFGTYEVASGKNAGEAEERQFTQLSGEVIYRFLENEQLFVGARYNTVSGRLQGFTQDVSVNRTQIGLGWFITKNVMAKMEYVTQTYNDFPTTDIRSGGKFDGFVMEAVVAF